MSDAAPPPASSPDTHASRTDSPPQRHTVDRLFALLLAIGYLVFYRVVLLLPDSMGAVLTSTVASLALLVWFTAQLVRAFRSPKELALTLALSTLVIVPLRILFVVGNPAAHWIFRTLPGLPDLFLICLAASLGGLLSYILRGVNLIPPVAAVLALVDIWTVLLGGPVQKIIESPNPQAQQITRAMTVPLPVPKVGAAPIHFVGFADFLFVAFFVAALGRFVPVRHVYTRMLLVMMGVLSGYMLLVFFTGWSLPALVPMSVVMIALHWRHFHYDRSEAFALLYAALFIALIAAGFWFYGRKSDSPPVPARAELPG